MQRETKFLLQERVFFHFYQISRIPRGSGKEKEVSLFLLKWAKELGLFAEQDDALNVFIRKEAASGYEEAPTVMLQAHMDMVCEKAEDVSHDFTKDPIEWVIDGDTLSTGGRTTLGADNGIGVALAMAILEDASLRHPQIEVLFTTMEEEDLSGASRFDMSKTNAAFLFNLDHVNDAEILCGSCGGMQADVRIPVEPVSVPAGWRACLLHIGGLKGGHSGEDIHRGRGNAIVILARAIQLLEKENVLLGAANGGSFRLAIPREAHAIVFLSPEKLNAAQETIRSFEKTIREELPDSADSICVQLSLQEGSGEDSDDTVCVMPETILDAVMLIPDGIHQMSDVFGGVVHTSDNLGEMYLDKNELHLILEIRSASDSLRTYLFERMQRLARRLGGSCSCSNVYPGWQFQHHSELRDLCGSVYRKLFGSSPAFQVVHAGLEVGSLLGTGRSPDAVSIGPNMKDFHSPYESLEISSVRKEYQYLCAVLSEIR